jgi:hypothetical protein
MTDDTDLEGCRVSLRKTTCHRACHKAYSLESQVQCNLIERIVCHDDDIGENDDDDDVGGENADDHDDIGENDDGDDDIDGNNDQVIMVMMIYDDRSS